MLSDLIVAPATPRGRSALAVVRVSGTGLTEAARLVIPDFDPSLERRATLASIVDPRSGNKLDHGLYVYFAGPHSYTGDDLLEVSTHGGLMIPAGVVEAFLAAGARLAEPGEFTRRAVINGKMDLLQAEAVADLVDATASAQRSSALQQLDRGLSRAIEDLRHAVLQLEVLISYDIDFPEEDDGPVSPEEIDTQHEVAIEQLDRLLRTSEDGERLRAGALVVIAGAPNEGKSSLFNALLGTERAIVTEIAGTTRDAIEAQVEIAGFPFRLVDTAGIHDSDDRIESMGIEVSHRYVAAADIVLLCVEAGRDLTESELAFRDSLGAKTLLVRTKTDVHPDASHELPASAFKREGTEAVRAALVERAFGGMVSLGDDVPVLTRARHRLALERARHELLEFARARREGMEGAVCATHLRTALEALRDVVGVVTNEDMLDVLFRDFCVGK